MCVGTISLIDLEEEEELDTGADQEGDDDVVSL